MTSTINDEFETPKELFNEFCNKHKLRPTLDACATKENTLCKNYLNDGLNQSWHITKEKGGSVWCNPPHSLTGKFVKKAFEEHLKHDLTIMMLIPANVVSSNFFHNYVLPYASIHFVKGRITFNYKGKPTQYNSRNAYLLIIYESKRYR